MVALVPFDPNQLPAHLRPLVGGTVAEVNDDLAGGITGGYPVIGYKGKTWSVSVGGAKDLILDEQQQPARWIDVVILKSNPALSKVYYPNGYEEGSTEAPTCYSNNGVVPASDASVPQANQCAICPHNQWGSRITDNGKKGKMCADSRRLAVAPLEELSSPHLLRVPAATLKELVNYANDLNRRGAPYQAVVTRITFDPMVAHPQFKFTPVAWLTAEQFATVQQSMDSDTTAAIVGLDDAPAAGALGAPPAHIAQAAAQAPAPQPVAQPAPQPVAQPAPQPVAQPAPQPVAQPIAQAPAPQPAAMPVGTPQAMPIAGGDAPAAAPAKRKASTPKAAPSPVAEPAPAQPMAMPVGQPQPMAMPVQEVAQVIEQPQPMAMPMAEPEEVEGELVPETTANLMVDAEASLDDVLSMLDD